MKKTTIALLALLLSATPFLFSGCGRTSDGPSYKMTLEVWGVFDDSDAFAKINSEYTNNNPQIQEVFYKKISSNAAEYEQELLDALASGKGPDVIFFQNNWLPKHKEKIAPFPGSEKLISLYKNTFVDVAFDDFVDDEDQIFAMPLYCDTLALFYNKDLLNQAGISSPPKTWNEVEKNTGRLTQIDEFGNIDQSAIALGRSKDPAGVNRATDILSLMMMQKGSIMYDPISSQISFNQSENGFTDPGTTALDFYTSFSNGKKDNYTWNAKMDYSVDSFRYGKTAMMVNYNHWRNKLKKTDPKLNFDIAPVPQESNGKKLNYANYWGMAVTKSKNLPEGAKHSEADRINEAWRYVSYATGKPADGASFDPGEAYLEATQKPTARRDLIDKQKDDSELGVFADQLLTAKSWHQTDPVAIEEIMSEMINDVATGKRTSKNAIGTAESRINTLERENDYLKNINQ